MSAEPSWVGVDRSSGADKTASSLFVGGRHIPIVLDALRGHWRFYEDKRWRNIEDIADLDQVLQREALTTEKAPEGVYPDFGAAANTGMALPEDRQDDLDVGADPLHFDLDFHKHRLASNQASITVKGDEGKRELGGVL